MISKKMQDALNKQINNELYSSYLYAAMAGHFDGLNLEGFSHWMKIQAQEEMGHAIRFYTYIVNAGGTIVFDAIAKPEADLSNPTAVFENVLKHERFVTGAINKLIDLAVAESDHATNAFLQWFITEQVEEEANADRIVRRLKLNGDNPQGLFMIDAELAARPAPVGAPAVPATQP